jgi:hypothetical protein
VSVAPFVYVDAEQLGETPHVVVDGAPRASTVLTLSHWPMSPTPKALRRDLSTEIAIAFLESPGDLAQGARAVTSDHLDEDGLCALDVLVHPGEATARADLLVEIARVGDFGVVRDLRAAKVALALAHLFDREYSPLRDGSEESTMAWVATCYEEGLARLPELCRDPDAYRTWFADELAAVKASMGAIASGAVTLDVDADLDLVVVTGVPAVASGLTVGHSATVGVHPFAIHSATDAVRVLIALGDEVVYYDRYETWVAYCSRTLKCRRDLSGAAAELSALAPGAETWVAEAPSTLVPVLRPERGRTELSVETIRSVIARHLTDDPAAWMPLEAQPAGGLSRPEGPRGGTIGRALSRWRDRRSVPY